MVQIIQPNTSRLVIYFFGGGVNPKTIKFAVIKQVIVLESQKRKDANTIVIWLNIPKFLELGHIPILYFKK